MRAFPAMHIFTYPGPFIGVIVMLEWLCPATLINSITWPKNPKSDMSKCTYKFYSAQRDNAVMSGCLFVLKGNPNQWWRFGRQDKQ